MDQIATKAGAASATDPYRTITAPPTIAPAARASPRLPVSRWRTSTRSSSAARAKAGAWVIPTSE